MTTHLGCWTVVIALMGCSAAWADPATKPTDAEWKQLATELEALRAHPPKTRADMERAKALHARLLGMVMASAKGDLRLKGEIVDEAGAPMKGVKLAVSKSGARRLVAGGSDVVDKGDVVEKVVDGAFDESARGSRALNLRFTKEGYYPADIGVNTSIDDAQLRQLLSGGVAESSTVVRDGVKIVMVRLPVPSPSVAEAWCELRVKAQGPSGYVVLNMPQEKVDRGRRVMRSGFVQEGAAPPPDALVLEVASENGKYTRGDDKALGLPRRVTLRMNAAQGGFQVHAPRWFGIEGMREAPSEGYLKEVVIDDQSPDMRKLVTSDSGAGMYFYFKTDDGKYVKARIRCLIGYASGTAEFFVETYLQTDGSRNVETR